MNGNFSFLTSIPQSENDLLQANCDDAKWNRYILYEVLPDLHTKLLEYVVKVEEARHAKERTNFFHILPILIFGPFPLLGKIKKNPITNLFKDYGLNVIRKLGLKYQRIFWMEDDLFHYGKLKYLWKKK